MRSRPASNLSYAPAWEVWGALLIVYLVWGSTYLAIRVLVETMQPLVASGIRFGTAGLVLAALLVFRGGVSRLRVTRRELASSALIGVLLLCVGNALVSVGETTVPSGIAALVIGVVPLLVLLLRFTSGERIPLIALLGVGVGFCGLAILAVPGGLDGSIDTTGMVLLLIASTSWAIGSFLSRRVPLPRDPFVSTTYQLFAASVVLLVAATVTGEFAQPFEPSTAAVISLLYLITFGSLLAYTAYTWLLQHAPITRVATYAYVNPVVAVFLGAIILNETITPTIAVGALLIVASVAFTIWAESGARRASDLPRSPMHRRRSHQADPSSGAVEPAPVEWLS